MFFLLRVAFWLSIVLVLLPSGTPKAPQPSAVGAVDAIGAAGAAVSDMSQFCERQPEACVVGTQAAIAFGQRAQAGARMVYDFISERMKESEGGSIKTGSVKTGAERAIKSSQHTLRPGDLQPAWRGPNPRKDASSAS